MHKQLFKFTLNFSLRGNTPKELSGAKDVRSNNGTLVLKDPGELDSAVCVKLPFGDICESVYELVCSKQFELYQVASLKRKG